MSCTVTEEMPGGSNINHDMTRTTVVGIKGDGEDGWKERIVVCRTCWCMAPIGHMIGIEDTGVEQVT